MAKPTKRRIEADETPTNKLVTPPKSRAEGSGRYTAPVPASQKGPSPKWVPITMFGLWIFGLLMIVFNYMGVLPGSENGNGWYLVGGLVAILGGILVSTQYH